MCVFNISDVEILFCNLYIFEKLFSNVPRVKYMLSFLFEKSLKFGIITSKNDNNMQPGFRSRSREPAIKIDGSETLRHLVDILLLELMKAYILL